jgi:hypothetical protein
MIKIKDKDQRIIFKDKLSNCGIRTCFKFVFKDRANGYELRLKFKEKC